MELIPTLVAGALLLVLVGSLPAVAGRSVRWGWLVYVGALLGGAAELSHVLNGSQSLPNVEASRVVKYATAELRRAREKNVLLIDGGSFADHAIDVFVLDRELARLGYSVHAVRLTLSGANHFERYRLQQDVERRLEKKRRPRQRWLYLAEVQRMYDVKPLATFFRNEGTTRSYHYLTPENAWYATLAMRTRNVMPSEAWFEPMLRHAFVNGFNVGVSSRLISTDDFEAATGRPKRDRHHHPAFSGLTEQLTALEQSPGPAVDLPWLFDIRERRERRLWKGYVNGLVYFGVPSPQPNELLHERRFCAATQRPCIAPDKSLLEALDQPTFWRDRAHMNVLGSDIYSCWFVKQLVDGGYLVK